MIITCQQCSTSYNLDETLLKSEGTKVRCTICKSIFTAYPPSETSPQYDTPPTEPSQSKNEFQDSESIESGKLEVPDDIAEVLGQSFNKDDFGTEEEINHLPSDMVHEVEEEEEINFDDLTHDEPYEDEKEDLDIPSTYDLSEGAEDILGAEDAEPEDDIALSPEDLDLVHGYESPSVAPPVEKEPDQDETQDDEPEESSTKLAYEDGSVTLSEEDLDLGVSMAAGALANDFSDEPQKPESETERDDFLSSHDEPDEMKLPDVDEEIRLEQNKSNEQIDIGAELDLEFGSELGDEISESSLSEDLDMELSLDDSEPATTADNVPAEDSGLDFESNQDGEEELALGIDFDEAFEDEDITKDTDDRNFDFDSEPENITSNQGLEEELDLEFDFDDASPEDAGEEVIEDHKLDFDLSDQDEQSDLIDDIEIEPVEDEDYFNLNNEIAEEASNDNLDLGLEDNDNFNLDFDFDDAKAEASEEDVADLSFNNDAQEDLNLAIEDDDDFALNLNFDGDDKQDLAEDNIDISDEKESELSLDLDFGNTDEPQNKDNEAFNLGQDDDFNLDLDFDDNKIENDSDIALAKDDDFGLDLDIGAGETQDSASEPDEDFNFDFDFDNSIEASEENTTSDSVEEELDLDLDFGSEKASTEPPGSDDLDLSDLQDLLESDQEKPTVRADESADLDLSDLEDVLENDQDDIEDHQQVAASDELELDLDIGSDLTETASISSPGKNFSAELDLSEFEYVGDSDEKSLADADDHFDTGGMEIEFQIDDKFEDEIEVEEKIREPARKSETQEMPIPTKHDEDEPETETFKNASFPESMDEEFEDISEPAKKQGISKPLILVLIAVFGLAVCYFAYTLLDRMNIQIPLIGDYLNSDVDDPGNLKLSTEDINSKFIDNASAGRMFVITGKVKSSYDTPRRFIQMTGKLFTKGKNLAKTEVVYCGNVISDAELTSLDIATIKKRLEDRFGGDQKTDTQIQPGKTLPFMVVFSDLPKEQLEEFTIEVEKSVEAN